MKNNNILQLLMQYTKEGTQFTDKKQRIVLAAIELFAKKGYANTATSEIAKEAGVAEGTIFRHFGTKENLLLAILIPFIKHSLPQVADAIFEEVLAEKPKTIEEFVRALATERFMFFKENRDLFRIFIKEMIYHDELKNELISHISEHALSRIEQIIQDFQEKGEVIDIPAKILSRNIFTTLLGFFLSRFVLMSDNVFLDDQREIDYIVQIIVNGIKQ